MTGHGEAGGKLNDLLTKCPDGLITLRLGTEIFQQPRSATFRLDVEGDADGTVEETGKVANVGGTEATGGEGGGAKADTTG
jgi:hypothetical protein